MVAVLEHVKEAVAANELDKAIETVANRKTAKICEVLRLFNEGGVRTCK